MNWKVCLTAVALCVAAASSSFGQQPGDTPAFRRAAHLQHGINTSIWFAQAVNNYGQERLRTFTTEDDLRLIHKLGFDHIRLSIDAQPLTEWQRGQPGGTMFMGELDRVVHAANADGLAVIIDIHPESNYKATLFNGTEGVTRFSSLWHAVASHFSSYDPEMLFFELMNEPEQSDPYRWNGIEAALLEQVRGVAPAFTVIATGAHWSGVEDLLSAEPLDDNDVIYTFHDYEPFAFTHQGATWTDPHVAPLRGVPYPSSPENVKANLTQEPSLAGKYFVDQYGYGHWSAARIADMLSYTAEWSRLHHAPVYCGEFGVHRPYANPADRARWIHDTRAALEAQHIGWAMWDYQTNFGLVTKANGKTQVDPAILQALGLPAQQ